MSTPTSTPAPTTKVERHAYAIEAAIEAAEALESWEIARLADCGRPARDTEGAGALRSARNLAVEAAVEQLDNVDPDEAALIASGDGADTLADLTDDDVWQSVDGLAVLIYTARTRDAFHQLDGWEEDVRDFGQPENLDQAATWALFEILRRAAREVVDHFAAVYSQVVEAFPELDELDELDEDGDE